MSSCLDASSPVAKLLIEKEATRIQHKIKDLVAVKDLSVSAGVAGVKFVMDRRMSDMRRNKKCFETDAGKKIHAILAARMRVDQMSHYNVRGAARKLFMKAKHAKARLAFNRRCTKKRLMIWSREKKKSAMRRC